MQSQLVFVYALVLLVGVIFVILAWVLSRFIVPRLRPVHFENFRQTLSGDLPAHNHGMLVVGSGGRVEYLNPVGRQWFDLLEHEHPNLESLARRIRPSEDFLKLCMTEGQARFSLNGRPMEAVSYQVPGNVPSMLISIRRPEISTALSSEVKDVQGSALKILIDFSQAVSVNQRLKPTVQAILENVERLVPADIMEIQVWDPVDGMLTPFSFGVGVGTERRIEKRAPHPLEGYAVHLVENRQSLLIPDVQAYTEIPYHPNGERKPLHSYIGVPLQTGGELVGTLEVGLSTAEPFTPRDLEILQLIMSQAAVAIRNSIMLEEEQKLTAELGGLANLAQAISSTGDLHDLFNHLVQAIAPLFDVEILGFLLYNENRHALEAQAPFIGMPTQIVELYNVPVEPGSPAENRFLRQETLITLEAVEDKAWFELGFQDFARAASIRDAALVPLVSAGRLLGYFQVGNHRQVEEAYKQDELRLLNIVANQAAPIIDNVILVQQARQRIQRSEALRRIAVKTSSSATVDEILCYATQELARLLLTDVASIFLFDETQNILRLHKESLLGIPLEDAGSIEKLFVDESQFYFTVVGSQRPFISGHMSVDERLIAVYRPLVDPLKMESVVIVPLVVRDRGIGELMIGSRKTDLFTHYDLQVLATAAGQLAAAMESNSLMVQTDENLRRRIEHLNALNRIGRELSTTRELNHLLQVVYDESLRASDATCGTILFFESQAGGEPKITASVGDVITGGPSPVEMDVLKNGETVVVGDINQSGYQPDHEGIQSELIVPITYQQNTVGLIHLHASTTSHFDQMVVEVTQSLAMQAAIALGNYRHYREQLQSNELIKRRADTMSRFFETTRMLGAEQPLEQSLEALAYSIQETTHFQVVLINVVEPETGMQRRVASAGIPLETMNMLKTRQQPWSGLLPLLRQEYKVGQAYFIPSDKRPVVLTDLRLVTTMTGSTSYLPDAWQPDDTLLYPLDDPDGSPLGLISLDAPQDGLRPDRATLEMVEIFAVQAALLIRSARRLAKYKTQTETLSTSLERQQQLLSVSQSHLPVLLHKDLEQMIAIRNLERRARRIRAGLEITETINRQVDNQSALLALGREMLTRLEMSVSIVAENTAEGPRLLHVLGNIPRATNPEALFGQRNPLRTSLQTGEMLLVMNLEQDDTWRDTSLLNSLHAKGFICLPILVDEKPVASILAISPEPMPTLTEEDRQVYFQISRQVSIILENISLLTETRRRLREVNLLLDFSRQLSGLEPDNILKALLDSALRVVTAAHAGVVLTWDEQESCLVPKVAANYADTDSLMGIIYHLGEALPGQVFMAKHARRVDEVNFARDYNLPAEYLLRYREATAGRLPVSSLLVPIQVGEQVLGVLVLDNFNTAAAFSPDDEALLLSLTQQVALSLENVRLVQASQERAGQLQALTSVSAMMTSSLQSDQLITGLLDQLRAVLPYDTAILWLRESDHLSVASARGFPDSEERIGLTVAVEDSALLKEMIRTMQGIVVGDIRTDRRFPALGQVERQSWMGVPLISKGDVIGVIALEKVEANFYTVEHTQLVTTFASQAAVSLENARLYEDSQRRAAELDRRSQRLALLNRLSSDLNGSLNEDQILRLTADELRTALYATSVSVTTFDRFGRATQQFVLPAGDKTPPKAMPKALLFDHLRESLGIFSTDNVAGEPDLAPLSSFLLGTRSLLVLPLASGNNLRALIFAHMHEEYHFSVMEIELARTITNQASVALENARLYQSTVSTAERLATINRASYEIGLSFDPEEIYAAIHRAVSQLMAVESFVISLLNEAKKEIEAVYLVDPGGRSPAESLPLGEGLSGRVISSGKPLLVNDLEEIETLGARTFGEGKPRSIVAVPIMIGGKVIGMLSAQSYQSNIYTEDDQQILGTLANQAAVAIQNGRLFGETRRLNEELEQRVIERTAALQHEQRNTETLLRILTEVSASLDLDRALNRTLSLLNDAIGAEQGSILLVNQQDGTLNYRAGYGYVTPVMTEGTKPTALKTGEGLAGWVIKNRQTVMDDDVRKDERWTTLPLSSPHHRSAIAAPLIVGEDVIGTIMVFHRQVSFFTPEHMSLVEAIGSQVAVAINNAQLYELIRDQAERLGSMLRNQQVEASRQQAILEAVADGVMVTDSNNLITFANSSASLILSLDVEQIVNQPLDNFVGLFGKAAQTWTQTIHAWSEDPASHEPGDTYAEQLMLETGHIVLVHLAPVILNDEFLGTVSIFRDITHEVEVDRLKSEFVATVGHELRTPMTSIKGYVEVLLMGAAGALNENQAHFLDIVRSNTERLTVLVNDLLDVSNIESGRVSLSLQPVELREIAEDIIADTVRRSQEENKPMNLSIDAPPDLPRVYGDLERIRQILNNLVDNAYHYTLENGQVTLHMQPVDGQIQVDVRDSGIGIPLADQERVFERFFRGEDPLVLATPGTGLGLAIVRQLVNMHKGRIWLTSTGVPGEGSTFSFTLPIYQAKE